MQTTILPNFSQRTYIAPSPQKPVDSHSHGGNHLSQKAKTGIFCTTLAGVAASMLLLAKCNKTSFLKSFATVKYEGLQIMTLAVGSVGGGLLGGYLFDDKKNLKAKLRESVSQLMGNILMPVLCVSGAVGGYNFLKDRGHCQIPKIKGGGKAAAIFNTVTGALPSVIASGIGLAAGIILGNKVANTLNEKVFNIKDNRKIEIADFSAHLDDVCLATTLVTKGQENMFSKCVSRVIPAALMVAGYSVGTTEEKHAK